MDQEKGKGNTVNTAKKFEETADIIKTVFQSVTELLPLFMEKWSFLKEGPTWKTLGDEQRRLKKKLYNVVKKQNQHQIYFFVLLVWNIMITLILVLKSF